MKTTMQVTAGILLAALVLGAFGFGLLLAIDPKNEYDAAEKRAGAWIAATAFIAGVCIIGFS